MDLLRIFAVLSVILTGTIHLVTYLGINPLSIWPSVMVMHVITGVIFGLFVVLTKTGEGGKERKALGHATASMKRVAGFLIVYAGLNFGWCNYINEHSRPSICDGQTVLMTRGCIVRRVLTENEYDYHQRIEMRSWSGFWIFFNAMTLLGIASRTRENQQL